MIKVSGPRPDLVSKLQEAEAKANKQAAILIQTRDEMIGVIEKILLFQMSLSLYEPLVKGSNLPRGASHISSYVLELPTQNAIGTKIDALSTKDPQTKERLKQFFYGTIGARLEDRMTFAEAYALFTTLT